MCGITAVINSRNLSISSNLITRMTDTIIHRVNIFNMQIG